jgi:hypothetical protein
MAIPRPRMHLRYAQPRISVYLSRAKDIKDAFKVCPTPDPCLVVEGQRHTRFPVSWHTENQIINSSYHKNSPDLVEGYSITHNMHWMLLTPSQGELSRSFMSPVSSTVKGSAAIHQSAIYQVSIHIVLLGSIIHGNLCFNRVDGNEYLK